MNSIARHIIRFILLITAQVLIFNNILLFGFINPAVFIIALLLMPLEIRKSWQYIIAFAAGFIIDCFTLTYGINASAALLTVFIRPYIIKMLNGKKNIDKTETFQPKSKSFTWLLTYFLFMSFFFHLTNTFLEVLSFNKIWLTLLNIVANTMFTTTLILSIDYIFFSVKLKK